MSKLREQSQQDDLTPGTPQSSSLPGDLPGDKENKVQHDAVFGEIQETGPDYRNVTLLGAIALMTKTQVGLGVLAIPASFDQLGLVPGMISLITIALLTGWAAHVVGTFKQRHPEVYGLDDAAKLMFHRVGYEIFSVIFVVYWIFIAGSGMLGISIGLNAISSHATCTAVFVAVAAAMGFIFGSIRTLGRISWLAWIGLFCIVISILTVTIAVGVQDRPAEAPKDVPWNPDYKWVNKPSFTSAISAVSGFVYAYGGIPAYFSVVAEMRHPQQYTKALLISHTFMTLVYLIIGGIVYGFCGSYVASPALGSAGGTLKKVCYAMALPGLLVSTALFIHVPGKYLLVRFLRGSKHLTANTPTHWMSWLGCTIGIAIAAYIVASAVPIFGSLASLNGSLFGSIMSFQFMGFMWIYDNWSLRKTIRPAKWNALLCWVGFVILAGFFLMVAGTYGSIYGIIADYRASGGSGAWSCADNSNS